MPTRNRTSVFTRPKGKYIDSGNTHTGPPVNVQVLKCTDSTDVGDCHHLFVEKKIISGGIIDRPTVDNQYMAKFLGYSIDFLDTPDPFPAGPVTNDIPSPTTAATQAAARTNPSRPYVDVPVALAELGDVLLLLRDSGRSLIRKAAGANIKYEFGIRPMAGDIAKLLNFQSALNSRIKECERLAGPRGLRRTVSTGSDSGTNTSSELFLQTQGTTIKRRFLGHKSVQQKVHVRWRMSSAPSDLMSPAELRARIIRALLGLTVDFSTAWELIPWSWLVDWGGNVGSYLTATRNIIPAHLIGCYVMRHATITRTCAAYNATSDEGNTIHMSGVKAIHETKSRDRVSISPTAHFPFLSGKQMGIISSLAVLRGRR